MRVELLKNIAAIIAGQSPPSESYNKAGEGMPFFQGKADYGEKFPVVRSWCSQPNKVSLPNDILISVRAPVGSVNINNIKACIGRGLSAIRVKSGHSYEYVYYFLKTHEKQIAKLGVGSTFAAITQNDLSNLKIAIPNTLSEELKIATILSKTETLIRQREKSIDLLDEFLKSTFLKMFGDPKKMEKSKLEKFGNYIKFITSGSRGWAKYYSNTGAKFLRIQNVWKGSLRLDDLQLVNVPNSQEAIRTKVKEGDLLLTITADLGRTAVVPKNFGDAYINQHLVLIRLDKRINPIYASYFFFMPFGYSIIQRKNKSAVKAGLNFNDIHSFDILVPPITLQDQFALIVEKTEILKQKLKTSLANLEKLYASLTQRAFKGTLDLSKVVIDETLLQIETKPESGVSMPSIIQEALAIASKVTKQFESIDKKVKVSTSLMKQVEQWIKLQEQLIKIPQLPSSIIEAQRNMARIQEAINKASAANTHSGEGFNWAILANRIKERYKGLHFNFEMLLNFIQKEGLADAVPYYASEELKANPRLNDAEDIRSFIQSAVQNVEMDEKQQRQTNPFLTLSQSFYNAEEENFTLSLHKEDFKLIKNKEIRLRSGIYFRITA